MEIYSKEFGSLEGILRLSPFGFYVSDPIRGDITCVLEKQDCLDAKIVKFANRRVSVNGWIYNTEDSIVFISIESVDLIEGSFPAVEEVIGILNFF